MSEAADDPRRARILEGATGVFLAYGFSRTTMDDIARAAELSRPALYLLFRNKTDIYRAICTSLLELCHERARDTLAGDAPLVDRLDLLVERALYDLLKDIMASPHGPDLVDRKNSLAGDIVAAWRARMDGLLDAAFAAEAHRQGVDLGTRGLDARVLAETFMDALEGMKVRIADPAEHLAAARKLVRVVVAAGSG